MYVQLIIGGNEAKFSPYVISLQYRKDHPCEDHIYHHIWNFEENETKHTHENDIPYSIGPEHTHLCVGSIIADKFIVTTSHCVYGKVMKDFSVIAGTRVLSQAIIFDRYCLKRMILPDQLLKVTRCVRPYLNQSNMCLMSSTACDVRFSIMRNYFHTYMNK